MPRKIIVTGATSMLGTALVDVAIREGIEVYAMVRKDTKRTDRIAESPLVHVIYGSLENMNDIKGWPIDCDVFYHLAWAGTAKEVRDDPEIHERNIAYTLDAVKIAKKSGCHRFVGVGSQAEFGPMYEKIGEGTKHEPITSYGIAKYAAGIMSGKLCKKNGLEHVWGIVFSVYGPHDNEGTMINSAIKSWDKGEIFQFSAGNQLWNYLYETDAGEMLYRLGCDDCPSGSYFIANQESRPLKEYIDILMRAYGDKATAQYDEEPAIPRSGLDVDMSRTLKILKYKPRIRFEKGVMNMIKEVSYRNSGGVSSKLKYSHASSTMRMAA